MSTSPIASSHLLKTAGFTSFGLGVFHLPFLYLSEETARFFSAPFFVLQMIRDQSPWLSLVVAVVVVVFALFGLYALAAAGTLKRRFPGQKGVLRGIAAIYTLRGLAFFPQAYLLLHFPGKVPSQTLVFSLVALALGLLHWEGLRRQAREGTAPA